MSAAEVRIEATDLRRSFKTRVAVDGLTLRVTAVEIYGPRIQALQLVHADDLRRWPWEARYRGVRGGQPVLGVRTTRPVKAA